MKGSRAISVHSRQYHRVTFKVIALGNQWGAGNRAKHSSIDETATAVNLGITLSQHSLEKRAGAEGGDTTQRERCVAFFCERSLR